MSPISVWLWIIREFELSIFGFSGRHLCCWNTEACTRLFGCEGSFVAKAVLEEKGVFWTQFYFGTPADRAAFGCFKDVRDIFTCSYAPSYTLLPRSFQEKKTGETAHACLVLNIGLKDTSDGCLQNIYIFCTEQHASLELFPVACLRNWDSSFVLHGKPDGNGTLEVVSF